MDYEREEGVVWGNLRSGMVQQSRKVCVRSRQICLCKQPSSGVVTAALRSVACAGRRVQGTLEDTEQQIGSGHVEREELELAGLRR